MNRDYSLRFEDLAESQAFAEFYRSLWDLLGIPMALVDKDGTKAKRFCPEQEMHPICQIVRSTEDGLAKCRGTDRAACNKARNVKHGIRYACHAGLVDFAVPIFVDGKFAATINGGQILPERPTEKGFKELWGRLKDLSIDKQALRSAFFASPHMSEQQLESLLKLISFFAEYFCEMGRLLKSAQENSKYLDIARAKEYMAEHFRDPISLPEVADQAALSPAYFSRLFKTATGITFTQCVQSLRLAEAKKLLQKTDMAISNIAFECGFNNLSYFNELFHKAENCSPSKFRKKHRK
jgi:AraC-like DNA-binding protein/ligand-binding sensor protein